jgi:hypothetical protein
VVENVLPPVSNEEVFKTVIIVIANAYTLAPTVPNQSGLFSPITESPVPVVMQEVVGRLLPRRKTFYPRSVEQKDIQPTIVVIVKEGNPTSVSFQDVSLALLPAVVVSEIEPRGPSNVGEVKTQVDLRGVESR